MFVSVLERLRVILEDRCHQHLSVKDTGNFSVLQAPPIVVLVVANMCILARF